MNDLISRQAAIKAIDDLPNCYNGYSDTYDKACIIGVLEEVPPIEPTEEMIKEYCRKRCLCIVTADLFERWKHSTPMAIEPKRGKWITKKDACGIGYQICSNCETEIQWRDRHGVILRVDMQNAPYCPNCGAKMERSEE